MSTPHRSLLAAALLLACLTTTAQAQVYRIVGPDGKVTFSDKPPADNRAASASAGAAAAGTTQNSTPLPFALRDMVAKYPVTLYTGTNCGPCGSGRAYLTSRGIPFVEKTVNGNEDIDALQRLAGDSSLPLLTVGGQQIKGYSDSDWAQYLDAAGYPKSSQLPANFRNPPATPLVALQRTAPAANATASADAGDTVVNRRAIPGSGGAAAPAPPPAAPANPAGIKF